MRLIVPSKDSSFLHSWLETEGALLQKISKLRVRLVTSRRVAGSKQVEMILM